MLNVRALVQMLPNVTLTMASVGSMSVDFGFSTKANFPFFGICMLACFYFSMYQLITD